MKVPYQWLKEYISISQTPEELADCLTMSGVEVGAIACFAPVDETILVGQVKELSPHPTAENLQLVQVDCGFQRKQVVCGAWNIREGDHVAVALPGSRLPGGQIMEEITIKGVISQGMILSAAELELDLAQDKPGVLIIQDKCQAGDRLSDILFLDQPVLELELTPNRADCLGLFGVAREVAAIKGGNIMRPALNLMEGGTAIAASIEIEEPSLCHRYTAREIKNVQVGPSPLNVQLKLLAAGIRPINNIVDATNYVMWETGQPMHAFDMEKIKGGVVKVRRAQEGERLTTLDGIERQLDPEVLVIADSSESIGLAGVMGGENTEITADTKHILLEAASFDPVNVRKTARKFNLPSDASQRFEKGIDREGIIYAQDRAVQLMQLTAGGNVSRGMIDLYPDPWVPVEIGFHAGEVEKQLGYAVSEGEIKRILEKLGLRVLNGQAEPGIEGQTRGKINFQVPSFRQDITLEVDLVEEIARLKGYDTIPTTLPQGVITVGRPSWQKRVLSRMTETLVSCGLQEIITFSFMNPRMFDAIHLEAGDYRRNAVSLKNPLTEDQEVMRTTLLPNMLKTLQYNFNRQAHNQFLFEQGAVFFPAPAKGDLPREIEMLSVAVTGNTGPDHWQKNARPVDFYYLKGILEMFLRRIGITVCSWEPAQVPFLHPTRGARLLVAGEELGLLGALHPRLQDSFEFRQEVYVAEVFLEPLYGHAALSLPFKALPRYPAVLRDAAYIVPGSVCSEEIITTIEEQAGEWLEKTVLFDVYQGQQIPEGQISLAFAYTFRHPEKTLQDHEVDQVMADLEAVLQRKHGAVLRRQ